MAREGGKRREREGGERDGENELIEKLVGINRVSKTVKGGRRFGFAALMVVGDGRGRVGFGTAKAREVPEAVTKATAAAKRSMIRVPLREARTIHHDVIGHYGAGRVVLRTAVPGTGIIAGGPLRAIFEALGVQDVVAKAIGSSNPYSMVNATFEALQKMQSPRQVAARRSKKVGDIIAHREAAKSGTEKTEGKTDDGEE
jgi:small subunit ribosomal protein S5